MKNSNKLKLSVLLFISAFFVCGYASAEVKYDADSPGKIIDFLLSQPLIETSLTGKPDSDIKETYPSFTDPLSNYDLTLDSKDQSFSPGGTISLGAKLKFNFKGQNTLKSSCPNCDASKLYPISEIPNTSVFVQVWRKDDDKTSSLKGDYLIDEFYALNNVLLKENEEKIFNVNWNAPASEKLGDYYFSFYINSAKRFNMKGTPLVAFYPAETFNFHLKQDKSINGIELDKNNIKVGNKDYSYRQPAPVIDGAGSVTVSVPLTNLSKNPENIKVTYDLLGWGQEDAKDLILPEKTENVTLASGEKKDLNFTFNPDDINSVYNLKIVASASDSQSVSNIRFVLKDKNRGIIRFLGMVKNQENLAPLFCVRNAQWQGTFSGKLKLTAFVNEKEAASLEKSGDFATEDRCFVVTNANFQLKSTDKLSLKAEVFNKDNKLVDERMVDYTVAPKTDAGTIPASIDDLSTGYKLVLLLVALLLVVSGLFIYKSIKTTTK